MGLNMRILDIFIAVYTKNRVSKMDFNFENNKIGMEKNNGI